MNNRKTLNFLKTTIIGGLVFLVPVTIIIVVLLQVFGVMADVAEPIAVVLPLDGIGDIAIANVLAVIMILVICFVAGLLAKVGPVARAIERAETAVLQRLPGYTFLKGLTTTISPDQADRLKPVIVTFDSTARIGLEVDRLSGGRVIVYIPDSPNALSGAVHYVEEDRIERVDIPMTTVIEHAEQLGATAERILANTTLTKR